VKIYYAHAKPIYRTVAERLELTQIKSRFPRAQVVNPAKYENHPDKRRDTMDFCFRLVKKSEAVVFSRYRGKITSGVGQEVNRALRIGLPVFELSGGHFTRRRKQVRHLSFDETLRLYGWL
jgi:hypothetical protein